MNRLTKLGITLGMAGMLFAPALSYAQSIGTSTKTIGYFYSISGTMVDAEDNSGTMSSYLTRGIRYDGTAETFAVSNIKDITGLVDADGNVLNKYTYTAYGTPTSYSSSSINSKLNTQNSTLSLSSNPYTYSGYYTDSESDNYYLNARYYDPTLGIFLTSDTYNLPNRNMYVKGNPVMGVDPSGHFGFFGYSVDTDINHHISDKEAGASNGDKVRRLFHIATGGIYCPQALEDHRVNEIKNYKQSVLDTNIFTTMRSKLTPSYDSIRTINSEYDKNFWIAFNAEQVFDSNARIVLRTKEKYNRGEFYSQYLKGHVDLDNFGSQETIKKNLTAEFFDTRLTNLINQIKGNGVLLKRFANHYNDFTMITQSASVIRTLMHLDTSENQQLILVAKASTNSLKTKKFTRVVGVTNDILSYMQKA